MHKLNIRSLPCLGIVSPFRSGGNLLNRLLDSHTQLLTNHSETFLSVFSNPIEKSIYKTQRLEKRIRGKIDKKKIFQSLIFNDFKHKIAAKSGWTKTKYDKHINYNYNYKKHYKYFQDSLKLQPNYNYRTILDIYIISFFKSFGFKNIKKEIKFFNTYWPNFSITKTNLRNFFELYPDGYLIYIVRNPVQWASSCKKRKPQYFSISYIKTLYERPILNIQHNNNKNILIIDFDDLILRPQKTMKALLKKLNLKIDHKRTFKPTILGSKIKSNSIFKEKISFKINKKVLNVNDILSSSEKYKISKKFSKIYKEILKKKI